MLNISEKGLEVLRNLAERPGKNWYISELAEASDVSQPTVSRTVKQLEEENIVSIEKSGRQKQINVRHEDYLADLVRVLTNKAHYMRDAAEKFCDRIKDEQWIGACILFGSVARGTADFNSDIDILVLVDTDPEQIRDEVMLAAETVMDETDFHISPTIMQTERYEKEREAGAQFVKSVEKDKVTLYDKQTSK